MTHNLPERETDFPANIGKPARQALVAAGYTQLRQLATVREADLITLHGMGPKALGVLRNALAERNLGFADAMQGNKHKEAYE